jgi:hypothetical protein
MVVEVVVEDDLALRTEQQEPQAVLVLYKFDTIAPHRDSAAATIFGLFKIAVNQLCGFTGLTIAEH